MINCIPVFIASDPEWGRRFSERQIPIIGDDVKAQLGATILHRALTQLFVDRESRLTAPISSIRAATPISEHAQPKPAPVQKDFQNRGGKILIGLSPA